MLIGCVVGYWLDFGMHVPNGGDRATARDVHARHADKNDLW